MVWCCFSRLSMTWIFIVCGLNVCSVAVTVWLCTCIRVSSALCASRLLYDLSAFPFSIMLMSLNFGKNQRCTELQYSVSTSIINVIQLAPGLSETRWQNAPCAPWRYHDSERLGSTRPGTEVYWTKQWLPQQTYVNAKTCRGSKQSQPKLLRIQRTEYIIFWYFNILKHTTPHMSKSPWSCPWCWSSICD